MNTLTLTEEELLLLLGRLRYLTNRQLATRLQLSLRWTQTVTARLEAAGLLLRITAGRDGRGSLPDIFTLATPAINRLVQLGALTKGRTPRSEDLPYPSSPSMRHTLSVNDVLIAAELVRGDTELAEYWHEKDIARMSSPVKPDAWLRFELANGEEHVYLLEVDLETEAREKFREKVGKLCTLMLQPTELERLFGTDLFYAVLIVAPTTKRLTTLGNWVQAELRARQQLYLADGFRYTTLAAATNPVWLATHV